MMANQIGTAFYFEDIDAGLLAMSTLGGETQMYRMTASAFKKPTTSGHPGNN
jgi:hypothetical protein